MQYRFISVLAATALVAVGNGAPIAQAPGTGDVIDVPSNPSTVVTWGKKRGVEIGTPEDSKDLGPVKTIVTWGKREAEAEAEAEADNKDVFTIGPVKSTTTWGSKREAEAEAEADNKDVFTIGPVKSTTTWGSKRDAEAENKDIFKLGPVKSTTTWGSKRENGPVDVIDVPTQPSTEVTWG